MKKLLLEFTDMGIYCDIGGVCLDPWKPTNKAIVTHGHADHGRWGHKKYITPHFISSIKHRLGDISVSGKSWFESFTVNNVKFSLHPAGHILG